MELNRRHFLASLMTVGATLALPVAVAKATPAQVNTAWIALLNDCKDSNGKYIDRTNANAVLRTMAQSLAMLTDKVQTEAIDTPMLSEGEQAAIDAAARVYKLKLSKGA